MRRVYLIVLFISVVYAKKLEEKYSWKELEFAWPSEEIKQEAIRSGKYIESNNLPLGLEVWRDKIFITVPRAPNSFAVFDLNIVKLIRRFVIPADQVKEDSFFANILWKSGVASSLNYFTICNDKSPVLHPYPTWSANELPTTDSKDDQKENYGGGRTDAKADNLLEKNNETIISTFRIRADECDRLWVMDSGLADILGSPKQWAPNSIAVFDLNTDKLIRRFIIPADQVKEGSFFANIIVDTQTSNCDNAFAYIPDLASYAVVVYDYKNNRSYRVKHNFFHCDPLQGDFTVGGINFQWIDETDVFGMALGTPINDQGDRTIYFHALASTKEFSVSNTVLKNETLATSNDAYYAYTLLGDRGPKSQSTAEFYDDKTNTIFYTLINRDAIGCWNIDKPYTPETQGLVDSDSHLLVFPNDLKIDNEGNLYVLSDRMPLFIYKELPQEVNYRILMGKTSEVISGTPCES